MQRYKKFAKYERFEYKKKNDERRAKMLRFVTFVRL